MIVDKKTYLKIKKDKPNKKFLNQCREEAKIFRRIYSNECEWDIIRDICQNAIKRNRFTKAEVKEKMDKILKEVREENNSKETIDNI